MKKSPLLTVLKEKDISPVLVDVGSSGSGQSIFQPIAEQSTIIGFDADSRGQDENFARGFLNSHLIPKAVTEDAKVEEVEFVLTEHPPCSSVLDPDLDSLKEYVFHDYFLPKEKVSVPATTLEKVLSELSLPNFDWIKLDSQGCDLRILKSLSEGAFDKLLAVDIEPGFISAYKKEDTFADTHTFLQKNGFWLSDLNAQKYIHMKPDSVSGLERESGLQRVTRFLKKSPTAAEARYFRSIEYFKKEEVPERSVILGAVFAFLDGQMGFAFDVLNVYKERFGENETVKVLKQVLINDLLEKSKRHKHPLRRGRRLVSHSVKKVKRALSAQAH